MKTKAIKSALNQLDVRGHRIERSIRGSIDSQAMRLQTKARAYSRESSSIGKYSRDYKGAGRGAKRDQYNGGGSRFQTPDRVVGSKVRHLNESGLEDSRNGLTYHQPPRSRSQFR